MIVVRESCIPPTTLHQAKRIVRVGGFTKLADSAKLVEAKGFWDALFLRHRPERPLDGPLALYVELRWPHTASTAKRLLGSDLPMTTKPDLSNLLKTVEDAMVRCGYMVNDSRICDVQVKKFRSPNPGILVRLGEVGE